VAVLRGHGGLRLAGDPGQAGRRVRVTTLDGQRVGVGRATARLLAELLSLALLGFGFVLAGVDARKQALHDKLAGTLVVRK
jgi:uncharacterized RDD family membrane protein YckC